MKLTALASIMVLTCSTELAYGLETPVHVRVITNSAGAAPSITAQPQNRTVIAGQGAAFTVTATGDVPLSYRWTFNGSNVGSSSNTYTRANCQLADNGGRVQVTVSNVSGSVQSGPATLTVATPPSITAQPQNRTVIAGQSAAFTVTVTGDVPLSYRWTFNGSNVGSSSNTYTRANCQLADNSGRVQVTVSNVSGSVQSSAATLTVATPPSITAQPQNRTVIAGQTARFTVTATGDAPLNYRWTFNGANVGSNNSAYTRTNCQLADDDQRVRVTVSSGSGSVQSSPATLTVNPTGTNYFVATNGSSSNTGLSTNSPWPLIYGVTKLGPGVTLTLMPGVYAGPVHLYYINGTALNPAIVRSQYKWQAIIANSAERGMETYLAQYIAIDGLCISNSYFSGIKVMDAFTTVRNCWFTHNGNVTDQNGIDSCNDACSNNVFDGNLVEFSGSGAGYGQGMYIAGRDNIIRNNVVRNNSNFGIQFYTSDSPVSQDNNLFYNNLTYGNTNRYGMVVYSATDGGTNTGTNYIVGNTILDGVNLSYGTTCLSNNIILPSPINPSNPVYLSPSRLPTVLSDYNLGTNAITPAGAHDVITNYVGFVNTANGLYWLKTDSPARNKATPDVFGPVDFFGRTQTSIADIGAFQYNPTQAGDIRVLDPSPTDPDYWSLP